MASCYKDARIKYDNGQMDTDEFIKYVWDKVIENARRREDTETGDHHISEQATKAFLKLYKVGRQPVYGKQIIKEVGGFKNYEGVGLWPWTKNHSDVIKQEKGRIYSIPNDKFYGALLKVVLGE